MPVMVQIRNVPDDLHRTFKARAAAAGMSLSDYLLSEMRQLAECLTPEEMRARLQSRPRTHLDLPIADMIRDDRDSH